MPRYVLLKSGEGLSSRPAAASPRPECYCCNDCVVNSLLSTRCDQASVQACAIFLLLARTCERVRARVHELIRGRSWRRSQINFSSGVETLGAGFSRCVFIYLFSK